MVPEDDPQARGTAFVAAAYVAAATGDAETARRHAREALDILGNGSVLELARARVTLGEALALVGDAEPAFAELRLAGEECARIGATMLLAEAEMALAALEIH